MSVQTQVSGTAEMRQPEPDAIIGRIRRFDDALARSIAWAGIVAVLIIAGLLVVS